MRVLLAGATGAIGRPLTAQLLAAGNRVVALTRSEQRAAEVRRLGASAVVADVWNRADLARCLREAQAEVVINMLTALPKRIDPRKVQVQLAETNRLRSEGTRNLFDAAREAGAKRFISQSIAFAYQPGGSNLNTEETPLYRDAPATFRQIIQAVQSLEATTLSRTELPGIVLRFGFFYGPGTVYAKDGSFAQDVQNGCVPLIGNGNGEFSFIHVADAAAATVAAIEHGEPGIYNVADDEPAPVCHWLPAYAQALGARPPGRVPRWLARLIVGRYADYLMCQQRGATNFKAKRLLGWAPQIATWRNGFAELAGTSQKQNIVNREEASL